MDGLTVFQAVFNGIQVISKIIETAENFHNAPSSIGHLMTEIKITKSILEQFRPIITSDDYHDASGAQHVALSDLLLVFTDLAKVLSKFDEFITQMSKRTGLGGTYIAKRSIWIRNEKKLERDVQRLQNSKLSLSSMLLLLQRSIPCLSAGAPTNDVAVTR